MDAYTKLPDLDVGKKLHIYEDPKLKDKTSILKSIKTISDPLFYMPSKTITLNNQKKS